MSKMSELQTKLLELQKQINEEKERPKKQIGLRIKSLRNNAGLTQVELSERLGLSRLAVANFESGNGWITTRNLILLCEIFQASSDDILGISS